MKYILFELKGGARCFIGADLYASFTRIDPKAIPTDRQLRLLSDYTFLDGFVLKDRGRGESGVIGLTRVPLTFTERFKAFFCGKVNLHQKVLDKLYG